MKYLVEILSEWHQTRYLKDIAEDIGIKRPNLSDIILGTRGVSIGEAKLFIQRYPELREAVIASLLDEDLDHRKRLEHLDGHYRVRVPSNGKRADEAQDSDSAEESAILT